MGVARWGDSTSSPTRHWPHFMISTRSTAEPLIMKVEKVKYAASMDVIAGFVPECGVQNDAHCGRH